MKVRNKENSNFNHEVIEESPNYYIVKGAYETAVVSKTHYEPVPTERWVDVTAACRYAPDILYHRSTWIADLLPGYRLRGVSVNIEGQAGMPFGRQAFIVEKKEHT